MSFLATHLCGFGVDVAPNGNDSFTKVLLHGDGADASTTITDSNAGGSAHTWTARGNAQIDTAASKFGGASILFDGTGDWVDTPDSADYALGSGNFTVDFWFNWNGGSGVRGFMAGQGNAAGSIASGSFFVEHQTDNTIRAGACVSGVATTVTSTTTITATGWHHVAFVRTGNTLKLFLDGTQEGGNVSFSSTVNDSSDLLGVGSWGALATTTMNGWIDEFRLSVGTARWTSNFTPPTVAYY